LIGNDGGFARLRKQCEPGVWRPQKVRAQIAVGRETCGCRELRERKSWAEVVQTVEKARGQKWEEFAGRHGDAGLAMALYVARRRTGMTLRALGEAAGGMDYTAVSMAVKRFEQRLLKEKPLRQMTRRLLDGLEGREV